MIRISRGVLAALLSGWLAACSNMVGPYRGPEPFGGKDYVISPPAVILRAPLQVVVLVLKDERPALAHELDWVRQAASLGDTLGQPREVRREFDRAIKNGLREHAKIQIVTPEAFADSRAADLIISDRILACEAEKKVGMTTVDFHGRARIEIVLRDRTGRVLTPQALQFSANPVKPWKPPSLTGNDEIPVGYAGSVTEAAIGQVVELFLSSRELGAALQSVAQAQP